MTQSYEGSSESCGGDLFKGPQRFLLWYLPTAIALLAWLIAPWPWPVWALVFLVMGAACSINAKGCGRVHCAFTGPLYLSLGLVAIARSLDWISLASVWFWSIAAIGTGAAFVPEWRGKRYYGDRKHPAGR